jgi:hypothetical protein
MALQEPQDIETINSNKRQILVFRAKYTFGVVAPNGVVSEHYCPPPTDGGDDGRRVGDAVLEWRNGQPQVSRRYASKGYVLYSEVAKQDDLVATGKAKKNQGTELAKYETWKRAITARIVEKMPIRGDVSGLYTSTVLQRRAEYKSGSAAGGKAFVIEAGGVTEDPALQEDPEEKLARRLEEAAGIKPTKGPTDGEA